MLAHIERLAQLLRKNGVPVSTAEVIDAVSAAQAVGVAHGDDLCAALRVTLIKHHRDWSLFDELFSMVILSGSGVYQAKSGALFDRLVAAAMAPKTAENVVLQLAGNAAELSVAARMALGIREFDPGLVVRAAGLTDELRQMTSSLQVGYMSHRIAQRAQVPMALRDIDAVLSRLVQAGALTTEHVECIRRIVERQWDAIRRQLREYVKAALHRQELALVASATANGLALRPLVSLSERELAALRGEVTRLARRLRVRMRLERKPHRRGRLDLRNILRRSVATDGVPFALYRIDKRRKRPRLVVLCDVSDSVRNVSRFMLQFVYTLQEQFERIDTFAFVAELGELTTLFARYNLDRAVELVYQGGVIDVFGNSNYGQVLQEFVEGHISKLTPRTTVLVIGDGRSNYHASHHALLGIMRMRAKRLIWMTPETPASWGFGDSAMRQYQAYCDDVVVARNLKGLRKAIDKLMPS